MSVLKSKYVPYLCCNHRWHYTHIQDSQVNQECDKCGAVCERGSDGQISYYSTLAGMNFNSRIESKTQRNRDYGSLLHDVGFSRLR